MATREPFDPPDLLHPRPSWRIDFEKTRLALDLAFAGGVAGGLFDEALDHARLAPSSWEASAFESDLFLRRFVAGCFKIRLRREEGLISPTHLARLLGHPPSEQAVVEHRRAILAELRGSAALRERLEELYRALRRMRTLLENVSSARNWDPARRQLDILGVVAEAFELLGTGFAECRSGLADLTAWGARVVAGEPFRSLTDLLRYDERLATLKLEIGVGADGRIRGFRIESIEEDAKNPFVSPPWRRWLAKLELVARGYSFSDGEVMARLVDAVFVGLEDDMVGLIQLVGDLEFHLGALGFADQAQAAGLEVCLPELVEPQSPRALHGLFNPLLLMSGIQPVPCDLTSGKLASTLLVTGPNSGGKTRLLQAMGLTQVLAQSGAFVPARAGAVTLASALVVSLIQETRADQAEGRLGMELLRIRQLFEHLPPGAMVLLDELCSGTNPSEGEEIFELVVEMLSKLAPQAFITTHFLTFAARLEREQRIPDLGFVQVELGAERRATYQFVPGVATTSLAGDTAERLGVTGDQLLSLIERNVQRFSASR
jgi:DNA mismatch repair protein MutS2